MEHAPDQDRKLDPRSVVAARLSSGVALAVFLGPALLTVVGVAATASWTIAQTAAVLATSVGAAGLLTVWAMVWPSLRFRYTRYRIDDDGLTIRRGVVWRSETSIPASRIQHTDVLQGPLQRQFQLATLVVHTAGTQHAAVSLGGLAHQEALTLRDALGSTRDQG